MDFDYRLLAKYIIEDLSGEEMYSLHEWKNLSQENAQILSYVIKMRISRKYNKYNTPEKIQEVMDKVNAKISHTRRLFVFRKVMKYAAIIILLLGVSIGSYMYFKPEKYLQIAVATDKKVQKVTLVDGTTVWLKSTARLEIPESFSAKHRYVKLVGDAFFDVTKSAEPFYVNTEYLNIGVYGTEFEVKVNTETQTLEATLVEGHISLLNKDMNPIMKMEPGDRVIYSDKDNRLLTEDADVNLCATWRYEQIVLESLSLKEITDEISKIYNIPIIIQDNSLNDLHFRYVFNKNDSIEDVMEHLKLVAPINYKIENNKINIWKNKP